MSTNRTRSQGANALYSAAGYNAVAQASGLLLGSANAIRHRLRGYRTPRSFGSQDFDRALVYDLKVVSNWRQLGDVDFSGKRILELGPGSDLGTGAAMVAQGAESYMGVDVNDLLVEPPDWFWEAFGAFERRRLGFALQTSPTLPDVNGPFDLIVSNSTLDGIEDLETAFGRLAELSAPGCRMVHHVDAKIHTRWLRKYDPLNHLRYPDRLRPLLDFPGSPNRLLAGDYLRIAEAAGFRSKIVPEDRASPAYVKAVRPTLAPSFRSRDDLELLSFTLVCDFEGWAATQRFLRPIRSRRD
jgi:hypothetical protein